MSGSAADARRRLQEQTTQLWAEPGVIDLGIGQPQDAMLPVRAMSAALARAGAAGRVHPLQYGLERGDGFLRAALADFLTDRYRTPVDPELILISNGNSHAIDLCCAVFTQPGDVVFVEEPTYFLALKIFADHGLRVVGVPVDADGLRIDALEQALARDRPAFVYTVPAAHNPTTATLPAGRRRRLVELAGEHGFLIVADEVYHLLLDGEQPDVEQPAPLAADVGSGVVLSLGTFSKILAPGLRLGWIQAAEPLLARIERRGVLVSGGGFNPFTGAVVAGLLEDGAAAAYLDTLRATLRDRIDVMDAALHRHLGEHAAWVRPAGGYFFWLRFADGVDTAAVRPRARALGVGYQPGAAFSTLGGLAPYLRLSFAYYGEQDLRTGVELLGRAFAPEPTRGPAHGPPEGRRATR